MDEGMDGWMDGWMDEWMDGWIDGWMDGWMNRWSKFLQSTGLFFLSGRYPLRVYNIKEAPHDVLGQMVSWEKKKTAPIELSNVKAF